jgi:hypothetical protein
MIVIVIGIGTGKDRAVKRGRGRKIGIVGHRDRVEIGIHGLERLTNINTCNWYVRGEPLFFVLCFRVMLRFYSFASASILLG